MKRGAETKSFQLVIKNLVRQEKVSCISDLIPKKSTVRPREVVRVLETLFKQRALNDYISVRNQFSDRNQVLDDLRKPFFLTDYWSLDLLFAFPDDGRGMANGLY